MAIFTAEKSCGTIRCWLDGREVTHLVTRADIPVIKGGADALPAIGYLTGEGSVDILNTDDEGYIIGGADGFPMVTRHYGMIQLGRTSA